MTRRPIGSRLRPVCWCPYILVSVVIAERALIAQIRLLAKTRLAKRRDIPLSSLGLETTAPCSAWPDTPASRSTLWSPPTSPWKAFTSAVTGIHRNRLATAAWREVSATSLPWGENLSPLFSRWLCRAACHRVG